MLGIEPRGRKLGGEEFRIVPTLGTATFGGERQPRCKPARAYGAD